MNPSNLESTLTLLPLVLIFHVGLLLVAMRVNVLALLGAMFLVAAPLSLTVELPGLLAVKITRIYLTMLIVALGLLTVQRLRPGPSSWAFCGFITFYVLAVLWSDHPFAGFMSRGLLVTTFLGGLFIALNLRSAWDLTLCLRILLLGALGCSVIFSLYVLMHPQHLGRLMPWGINANALGLTATQLVLVAIAVALYDPSKQWRLLALITGFLSALLLLNSASRGAVVSAIIGCFILAVPLVRRPGKLFVWTLLGGIVLYGLLSFASESTERLGTLDFANREGMWSEAQHYFQESPIFGQGWVYSETLRGELTTSNLHSAYLNILAETGVVGGLIFAAAMTFIGMKLLRLRAATLRTGMHGWMVHVAGGFFLAVMAHGMVESAMLTGTTVATLMLGFSVGLLDRISVWSSEAVIQQAWARSASSAAPAVASPMTHRSFST